MKRISEYKNFAGQQLVGNWGRGAVATLINAVILGVVSLICQFIFGGSEAPSGDFMDTLQSMKSDLASNVLSIFLLPLLFSYSVFFLNICRGSKPYYSELFNGFRTGYVKYTGTLFLVWLYSFLWTLLFVIPGVVKSYSYSMTSFVMKDNPELKYNAAIDESMRLMQGHKMQLFLLDLSMIGWAILSCLTLGVGFFFLCPYNQTAHAAFYEDLKKEAGKEVETEPEADFQEA